MAKPVTPETIIDTKTLKQKLLAQLLKLASDTTVHCRMDKMEEVHKRLNAIERVEKESVL